MQSDDDVWKERDRRYEEAEAARREQRRKWEEERERERESRDERQAERLAVAIGFGLEMGLAPLVKVLERAVAAMECRNTIEGRRL